MLFYPLQEWQLTPAEKGYEYHDISIKTHDGIYLSAWLMPSRVSERKGAIIYFHGNAQNISTHVQQVYWLTDVGYDIVLVDYRGYGHSEGETDFELTLQDIATALQWFVERYHHSKPPGETNTLPLYMLGQSLGAAMSGYVIATHDDLRQHFSAVILDAGFAQYRQIMRDVMSQSWLFWPFQYPASLTMPDDHDLLDVIDKIAPTPLLIIHGQQDPIVPYQHGLNLYNKALQPKHMLSYQGVHITALLQSQYQHFLLEYLSKNHRQ